MWEWEKPATTTVKMKRRYDEMNCDSNKNDTEQYYGIIIKIKYGS